MVMKFEKNKKYKFDYDCFKENYIGTMPVSIHDKWTKKCHNKIIKILNEDIGEIIFDGIIYNIEPSWCKEIKKKENANDKLEKWLNNM